MEAISGSIEPLIVLLQVPYGGVHGLLGYIFGPFGQSFKALHILKNGASSCPEFVLCIFSNSDTHILNRLKER